ncbi:hypothetical protein PAEPH01_0333 [Pancytospora epiphaga]|nr:hypothetical protein PAEPH01_0333 [Pancytospora epiphaga]
MFYKITTKGKKYETESSVEQLLGDLKNNGSEITRLDLSLNTFTPDVFKLVAKAIEELSCLKELRCESFVDSLTYNEMCSVLTSLCDSLPRDLEILELPSNALSCNFPEALGRFISECPLKTLALNDCGLGEDGLIAVAKWLEKLPNKKNLETLNLSKNRINKITPDFIPVFNGFVNLKEFRIRSNTIEEKSMAGFLKGIKIGSIEVLDLSDNFICGDCHTALGQLFIELDLHELYLQDAKMDVGGLNVFLKLACTKLTQSLQGSFVSDKPELVLDISCLGFEQDSVSLLEELASKFALKRLVLFENDYEDIENLIGLVAEDGGVVIEDEEELEEPRPDLSAELIEKLKAL